MSINWGIIGAGHIAEKFLSDICSVNHVKIIAIVSKTRAKAENLAAKYKIQKVYDKLGDFVTDSEIDAVYISTPHNLHFEQSKLCIENNKAVLCEKPMTVNWKQFNRIQKLASERKVLLMEAMWTYFLPSINQAQNWILQGKIGNITQINAEFGFKAKFDPQARLFNPHLAGGALLDIGIYPIAFANLFIKKRILKIKSTANIGRTGVDASNATIVEYEDNKTAILSSTFRSNLQNKGIIYGTKGNIEIPEFWKSSRAILTNESENLVFEDKRNTYGYNFEIEHFNKLLNAKKSESEIVSFNVSGELIRIMDEIRKQNEIKYPFE